MITLTQFHLESAIILATNAHRGQRDGGGEPYILHALRVGMAGKTLEEQVTGILHDVVEDTEIPLTSIRARFGDVVAEAVKALTKCSSDVSYEGFIRRVALNPLATRVKLNDLADNMRLDRLGSRALTKAEIKRHDKYVAATAVLLQAKQRSIV